jgi:hypothetical protein
MAEGAESVLEQNHEEAPAAVAVSRVAQEPPLTAAFQLGWRVAGLYALVNDSTSATRYPLYSRISSMVPIAS